MSSASISRHHLRDALEEADAITLIDVREPDEFASGHIETATNIPLTKLAGKIFDHSTDTKIVFVCKSGKRSMQAANFARSLGYSYTYSLDGGMNDWK